MNRGLPTAAGAVAGGWLASVLARSAWSVRVHDADRVPITGPVILAPNHVGFIDGPLLFGVSPRPVHTLVKREMFSGPVGWVLRLVGQIPVDRASPDKPMLDAALGVLAEGRILAIFPEGTRGAGDFAEVRTGLAWFALRSGAPVVPVVFVGTGTRGRTLGSLPRLRSRLHVAFGDPVEVSSSRISRTALEKASNDLQAALTAHRAVTHERFQDTEPGEEAP